MIKNNGKYLKSQAGVILLWIALFFGIMMHSALGSRPSLERNADLIAVPTLAAKEVEQIRNEVISKYESLRFVYRMMVQLRHLHAEESALERQQKTTLQSQVAKAQPRQCAGRS
jgi:hypothetical protein